MTGAPSRRNLGSVAVASGVAAVAGYVVMLVTARVLTLEQNTQFLVFWSVLFFVFGLLGGLQNEATRAVRAAHDRASDIAATPEDAAASIGTTTTARPAGTQPSDAQPSGAQPSGTRPTGARVLPVALAIGAGLAVLLAVTALAWAPAWFPLDPVAVGLAVSLGALLFAGHAGLAGILGGRGEWGGYSLLVGAEATTRLLLVVVAAVVGALVGGLELASALAAGTWLVLALVLPRIRATLGTRVDVPAGRLVGNASQAMVATAATAALVVGYPVLLRLTTGDAEYALAAPLLLAISFTRAPLMLVVNAFQGVAIATFVSGVAGRRALLARLVAGLAAVTVIGAALAWLAGPWLLTTILGPEYEMTGMLLALLVLASLGLGVVTLTGAMALALGRHRAYMGGWVAALVASVLVLLSGADLTQRATVSLLVGPVVGAVVHLVWIRGELRRSSPGGRDQEIAGAPDTSG